MTRFSLAGAAVLGLISSAAMAQTSTSESPAVVAPAPILTSPTATPLAASPPVTVSSSASAGHSVQSDGRQTLSSGVAATDSTGQTSKTTVSTTSYPLSNMVTTTTTRTEIVNGVPKEVVT